jgi:hypothetical protein
MKWSYLIGAVLVLLGIIIGHFTTSLDALNECVGNGQITLNSTVIQCQSFKT